MRPGRRHAIAAGTAEFAGGLLLILGLVTPLAAAMIIAVMIVAIATVHANNGPWVTDSGWEYNAVLIAVAFALTGAGPGEVSLDDAIGWMPDITGTGWAFGALGVGLLGALAALGSARAVSARQTPTVTTTQATTPAAAAAVASGDRDRFARDDENADIAQRERPGIPADPR
jgi:putative oxidoreductase